MTPNTLDIVDRLRNTASRGISSWGDLQMQAADEIQILRAERDNLAAALRRIEAQKRLDRTRTADVPVGEVRAKTDEYGGTFVLWRSLPVAGMMLYAAPHTTDKDCGSTP